MSVGFKEGQPVQQGQVLASIDPRTYQIQLDQAEAQFASDRSQLAEANGNVMGGGLEARIKADQAALNQAKLHLVYTQIASPISGVAGLRLIDPGNIVHASDSTGIVTITRMRPIAVLFTVPEDVIPQVAARLRHHGPAPLVEAWSRDNTLKIATGQLQAVDNQIDAQTGTARLKATFDNADGLLFPNQFVNVRLRNGTE
jgi:multidrug efflux system membrane fusion protein